MTTHIDHVFVPPSGADPARSATTVLLLHEAGGDEHALVPVGRGVAQGFGLLSPRGQVMEHGEPRFFSRSEGGSQADIVARAAEMEKFLRDAADQYHFDSTRMVALGYSDGATMAAALLLLYPRALSGAVLMRPGMLELGDTSESIAAAPVLVLAGQNDVVIPSQTTQQLARALSAAGAKVEVRWSKSGHELEPEDFKAAKDFFSSLP